MFTLPRVSLRLVQEVILRCQRHPPLCRQRQQSLYIAVRLLPGVAYLPAALFAIIEAQRWDRDTAAHNVLVPCDVRTWFRLYSKSRNGSSSSCPGTPLIASAIHSFVLSVDPAGCRSHT